MGILSEPRANDLIMGKKIPPALAVELGIPGEITSSPKTRPYDKPNVLFPSHRTKTMATLSPSPVFTNPLEKKNDTTISHITSFVKAEKAAAKVRVLVTTVSVRQTKAQAATGRGLRIRPTTVVMNMERRDQALAVTAAGLGTAKRRIRPRATQRSRGRGLTPFHLILGKRRLRLGVVVVVVVVSCGGGDDIVSGEKWAQLWVEGLIQLCLGMGMGIAE